MAQLVTGIVGGAVGFFLGGPYGAAIGFSVGSSVGALFSNNGTTIAGNTLGDIATQTSKEGVARPIIWGRVRPIAGNLIACSEPKIVKEKHKSGGKGGGSSTTTTTESVYRTYAIRVCEGPITRFVRIWRNNELVYDNRPVIEGEKVATTATTPTGGMSFSAISQWGEDNNAEFLKNGRLYLGDWDQMPDAALEGIFGAGNVPPHRGTAYMVMDNELLNDTGGAVPQWTFEVERVEGFALTSKPYEIYNSDYIALNPDYFSGDIRVGLKQDNISESVYITASIEDGSLIEPLQEYDILENISFIPLVSAGELKSTLIQYTYQPELISYSPSINSGLMYVALVNYGNYPAEKISYTPSITSGSLL